MHTVLSGSAGLATYEAADTRKKTHERSNRELELTRIVCQGPNDNLTINGILSQACL